MNPLRSCVLFTAALALLTAPIPISSAQMGKVRGTTAEQRAAAQTELMESRLGLSAEQTRKVAAINDRYAQLMEPVIRSTDDPLVKRRRAREIIEAKEAELRPILSAEQFQKYLALKQEIRQRFEERAAEEKAKAGAN
ncbi:MAG TPA: hypothetical protein VEL75_15650 [Candidatus Methylomirabilis sp.]|nr:hypothetical protein [Candidatus Methylomirabilis sp.]